MKPSELSTVIKARFEAGIKRPLHIEGSPGLGKTQIPGQVAKELGIGFKVIHAPLMQPEDYGFPVITAGRDDVQFVVSRDKFPLMTSDCPDKGILLIDELPQADNSAQKILSNLLQEREIHGQRLKPGWMIITTGNRVTDRAGANRLLSHLGNRLCRVPLEVNIDDWRKWAIEHGVNTEILAFTAFRPALLNSFDPQLDVNPTPRGWVEGVSPSIGMPNEFELIKGDVGEGPAAEFMAFLKVYRDLPTFKEIYDAPTKVKVSTQPSVQYATVGMLAEHANAETFDTLMLYAERLPAELRLLFVFDSIKRKHGKEIATTAAFKTFCKTDGKHLLT